MHLISSSESERGHKEIKGAIQCTDCWKEKKHKQKPPDCWMPAFESKGLTDIKQTCLQII